MSKMSLWSTGSFLWVTLMVALLSYCYIIVTYDDKASLQETLTKQTTRNAYQVKLSVDSAYWPSKVMDAYTEETEDDETSYQTSEMSVQELFEYELSLIPDSDLQYLYDHGWTITLTDMNLAMEYGYSGSIVGITDYEEKIVYVANRWSAIRRATIHEVGHALCRSHGRLDSTTEFIGLYNEEKDHFHDITSVGDGHEIESACEYFASVYQNMVLDYEGTRSDVPLTVAYIERELWGVSAEPTVTTAPRPTPAPTMKPTPTVVAETSFEDVVTPDVVIEETEESNPIEVQTLYDKLKPTSSQEQEDVA